MTSDSDELGAVDQLLHRGEANPRTRSGIMALELLDTAPDWQRYRTNFENASRKIPRLRQKVVTPTLPTAAPRWVVDPDFNLDFHVRRLPAEFCSLRISIRQPARIFRGEGFTRTFRAPDPHDWLPLLNAAD